MSPLRVEVLLKQRGGFLLLDGEGLFRLLEPFAWEDAKLGTIIVPAGFETDFCSIPAPARPFFPISGKAAPAGVLHDWLLRSEDDGLRRRAAAVFNRALKQAGVHPLRRWIMVGFVFLFKAPDIYL